MARHTAHRCWDRADRVCNYNFVWKAISEDQCIPSLILSIPAEKVGLQCEVILRKIYDDVIAVPVDKQHWLVSSFVPRAIAYQTCRGTRPGDADTTNERDLSGMSLIQIPEACQVTVGTIKMVGYSITQSSQRIIISPDNETLETEGLNVVIKSINSSLSLWSNKPLSTFRFPIINTTLFNNGRVTLNELKTRMTNLDDITLLDSSMPAVTQLKAEIEERSKSWFEFPWWVWTGLSLATIVGVGMLIWRVYRFCRLPQAAALGTAMYVAQPPRSFAEPIPSLLNVTMVTNSTSVSEVLKVFHSEWIGYVQMSVSLIIMVIMLLCAYKLHKIIMPAIRRMLTHNQVFPHIKNMSHHPGEVPVTLTILCDIQHVFHKPCTVEFGIQVGTLPCPEVQWYIDQNSPVQRGVEKIKVNRWNELVLKLHWNNMCIKSHHLNVETCQAFPHIAKVRWYDLLNQVSDLAAWDGISITPLSVTTVAVGQSHSRRLPRSYLDNLTDI